MLPGRRGDDRGQGAGLVGLVWHWLGHHSGTREQW
jgi:hypothetical protein